MINMTKMSEALEKRADEKDEHVRRQLAYCDGYVQAMRDHRVGKFASKREVNKSQ